MSDHKDAPAHHLISPTAKLVAHWRQYADIPFAKEVAEYARVEDAVKDIMGEYENSYVSPMWTVPYIEARYKCIMKEVDRLGIKQILELASGLSLRGLATLRERNDLVYVETDLPGMHQEKMHVVRHLCATEHFTVPANLHFFEANALNLTELEKACAPLDPSKPVAIVHEGLAPYFTMAEKRQLAGHIHTILQRFGGVWITPDFDTKERFDHFSQFDESGKEMFQAVGQATRRSFDDNAFDDETAVVTFFQKAGFTMTHRPLIENVDAIFIPNCDGVSLARIKEFMQRTRLWTLKLAG